VHLSRDENNSRRSAAPPPMLKGAVIPLPFMKAKKKTEQQQDERMKAILCTMYIQVATRCCFVLQQEIMPVIFCQRLS